VKVFLLRVEIQGADGSVHTIWQGDGVSLKWQFHEIQPSERSIGYPVNVDLVSVVKDKFLDLHPVITPLSLQTRYRGQCDIYVTLQARSAEADSPSLRLRIVWDGNWHEGREEMLRYFSIREAPAEA
jgi:hypothetical protein